VVEKIKGKILVTGADGMLGSAVVKELADAFPLIVSTIKDLDITDEKKVNQVIADYKPWIIIHTAAFTDVDGCEDAPELAYKVNALGAKNIAFALSQTGSTLIYISTDYIFDGSKDRPYREDDEVNPISVYGKTKLEGERFVASLVNNFIIIRSSWLFGKGKLGFVEKIIEQAKTKKTISVVADKSGSPTYVNDLAKAILNIIFLMEKGGFSPKKSVFHITNSGFCSWIEYAKKIIEFSGIEGITLKPVNCDEFKFKARRPRFSALDNSRYNKLTGKSMRPWQDALKEYLQCTKN